MITNVKEYQFKDEKVSLERWGWIAIYNDDSYLQQFDSETVLFHQFKEIDLDRLKTFVMQSYEDPSKRYEIHIKAGMRPIHFYRNIRPAEEKEFIKLYCFGYQETIKGRNVKTILIIHPNDMVAVLNDDGRPE